MTGVYTKVGVLFTGVSVSSFKSKEGMSKDGHRYKSPESGGLLDRISGLVLHYPSCRIDSRVRLPENNNFMLGKRIVDSDIENLV